MSKLYIFGIGGTGSRVLKSLIMLLGAGVEMKNTSEIVPVIIDPDFASADLTRTIELIKRYKYSLPYQVSLILHLSSQVYLS